MIPPIALTVIVSLALAATTVRSAQIERGELASRLEAFNSLIDHDFDTTFDVYFLPARPLAAANDEPWLLESWEDWETFRYVTKGRELYICRTAHKRGDSPNEPPTASYVQENVWTNREWVAGKWAWVHRVQGDRGIVLAAQAAPTDMHDLGFIINLIEGRVPSYRSLADIVSTGRVIDQRIEDGQLVHRFLLDDKTRSVVQHEICARLDPRFELLSHTVEFSETDDPAKFADHVYLKATDSITEWADVDGVLIPWRAMVETIRPEDPRSKSGPTWVSRAYYVRTSWKALDPDDLETERVFEFSIPNGTGVYDYRSSAGYRIGESFLTCDGSMYELAKPVQGIIGSEQADLIRGAEAVRPIVQGDPRLPSLASNHENQAEAANLASSRPASLSLPVLVIVVGVAGLLILVAVVRMLHHRRASERE